jgi:NADH dehydrogenase
MREEDTMERNITILGGGYGGAVAAARIAKRGIPVTLVDAQPGLTERIRLHQMIAGDDLTPVPYRKLFGDLPVDFVQTRVRAIDRENKRVITADGELAYDTLVYALGSQDALSKPLVLRERVRNAGHVVVVGGGLTGIETASEIAERHPQVDVSIVERGIIGSGLSNRARKHLHEFFGKHGVTVFENATVAEVRTDGVQFEDGRMLYADAVLWCGPFRMSDIARDSGLDVNDRGQILVDEHLRSSDPSIYAIGDAAFVPGRRMSCALALPMGAYIADYLSGATRSAFAMGFAVQCISLGRNDGIVQFVNYDDAPKELCLTGRTAAWIKELICRYAVMSIRLETRGVHYHWPQAEAA